MKSPKDYFEKIKENMAFNRVVRPVDLIDHRRLTDDLLELANKYPERFFNNDNCMAKLVDVLKNGPDDKTSLALYKFVKFAELFPARAFKNQHMMKAIFTLQNSEERLRELAIDLSVVTIFHAVKAIEKGDLHYKEFCRSPFMRLMTDVAQQDSNVKIYNQLLALFELDFVDKKEMATEPLLQDFFKSDHAKSGRIFPFDGFEEFDNQYQFGPDEAANLRIQCDRFLILYAPQARQGAGVIR